MLKTQSFFGCYKCYNHQTNLLALRGAERTVNSYWLKTPCFFTTWSLRSIAAMSVRQSRSVLNTYLLFIREYHPPSILPHALSLVCTGFHQWARFALLHFLQTYEHKLWTLCPLFVSEENRHLTKHNLPRSKWVMQPNILKVIFYFEEAESIKQSIV